MKPKLVVATGNAGKLREFVEILDLPDGVLGTLADVPDVVLPEEGAEYLPNAIAKARAVADQAGLAAIADDSGLEVDALGGAPGPLSARYGGPGLDDAGRIAHLLAEIARHPGAPRTARFVCVAALAIPDGETDTARGVCEGEILEAPGGEGGFGYDPIFRPQGYDVSMAELETPEKNVISHRGRALAELRAAVAAIVGGELREGP
jgi:XTP/dITP diphosphohydrolase